MGSSHASYPIHPLDNNSIISSKLKPNVGHDTAAPYIYFVAPFRKLQGDIPTASPTVNTSTITFPSQSTEAPSQSTEAPSQSTEAPSQSTDAPSQSVLQFPSEIPTRFRMLQLNISDIPTESPSYAPSVEPSQEPTYIPSDIPTIEPTHSPSIQPSSFPSTNPTDVPSSFPSFIPSNIPTSYSPSYNPSHTPSQLPSDIPSVIPTNFPSISPTYSPSTSPTIMPSSIPTIQPTYRPSMIPNRDPTVLPTTASPSYAPSPSPSMTPSYLPSTLPSTIPSNSPTIKPSIQPSYQPTNIPNQEPTLLPTFGKPSCTPTISPSCIPTLKPTYSPTEQPSISNQPSISKSPFSLITISPLPSFQPTFVDNTVSTGSSNQSNSTTTVTIAAAVVGGLFCCFFMIFLFTWFRHKKNKDDINRSNNTNTNGHNASINTTTGASSSVGADHVMYVDETPFMVTNPGSFQNENDKWHGRNSSSSLSSDSNGNSSSNNHHHPLHASSRIGLKLSSSSSPSSSSSLKRYHINNSREMLLASSNSSQMTMAKLGIPAIQWEDIRIDTSSGADMVIGEGSFGRVILARLLTKKEDGTYITNEEIVVKVIKTPTKLKKSRSMNADYDNEFRNAIKEVKVHMDAESKIFTKDCIAKVYGIVEGELPKDIAFVLNAMKAVGIVMRYEAGGSLAYIIHATIESEKERNDRVAATAIVGIQGQEEKESNNHHHHHRRKASIKRDDDFQLRLVDKIRVLSRVALGLAELHKVSIVHGDIKPDNVLLSSYDLSTAEVRLADFGLAELRDHVGGSVANASSIIETRNDRGTPIYCAPEMLYDPFKLNMKADGEVTYAKPSEKTDMYAFSILTWEVLTQQKPFHTIAVAAELSVKVHQGVRPNINELPTGCPTIIRHLIETGWDSNRYKRRSAADCAIILRQCYEQMISSIYDVYLTYRRDENDKLQNCMDFVHRRLIARGLRVCFLNDRSFSITAMNNSIHSSHNSHSSHNMNDRSDTTTNNNTNTTNRNPSVESKDEFEIQIEKKLQKIKCIAKAKVILVCIDEAFQKDSECLYELQSNRDLKIPRQVIPLFLEPTHTKFPDDEIKVHCQLSSAATQTFTIASLASDDGWSSDEGPSEMLVTALNIEIDRLCDYIHTKINE